MRTRRWVAASLIAVVATAGGAIALAPVGAPSAARAAAGPVADLVQRIDVSPENARLHAQLAGAYLQKSRDEADPSFLPRAQRSLERSLTLQPADNLDAYLGMASLANARHDFTRSVRWARRAIRTQPFNANAYGLLGDALFELGSVRAADEAYDKMVRLRPNVASYVRVSYALQHHGRTRAAIAAMRLALEAAGPQGETAAWVRHQMGDIYAGLGRTAEAERQNRIGVSIAPGFVPPTVGVAEAHIARGELERALSIMIAAADRLPTLEYMITLGELYEVTGRADEASERYDEVATKLRAYRAAGVRTDADFIVFHADHGLRIPAAVREARLAYRERPTPKMADAFAWILSAAGRQRTAWRYSLEAIRVARPDAGAVFHAGVIADRLGYRLRSHALLRQALRIDPGFSLVNAPAARAELATAERAQSP